MASMYRVPLMGRDSTMHSTRVRSRSVVSKCSSAEQTWTKSLSAYCVGWSRFLSSSSIRPFALVFYSPQLNMSRTEMSKRRFQGLLTWKYQSSFWGFLYGFQMHLFFTYMSQSCLHHCWSIMCGSKKPNEYA
jgi:hypothetical protein